MSSVYIWQKTHQAMTALVSSGSIDDRITFCFQHLVLSLRMKESLPPDLQTQFQALFDELDRIRDNNLGDEEREGLAKGVLDFFDKISRHDSLENPTLNP